MIRFCSETYNSQLVQGLTVVIKLLIRLYGKTWNKNKTKTTLKFIGTEWAPGGSILVWLFGNLVGFAGSFVFNKEHGKML